MSISDFEGQARKADGQTIRKSLLDTLVEGTLSENDLKNLEIRPVKKFLGPICEGSLGEIFGPRGIGKTYLRDVLALCLTRQIDLGPFKCENPAGILVIDGEMSLNHLKERLASLSQNMKEALKPLDLISNEYFYREGIRVINLANKKWRDAFIGLIKATAERYDVIVFDNLSSFLPGIKENDQEAWAPINGFLLQLRWMGKAVIFIHHAGKGGDQRGTSGREDQLDFVLKLTLPAAYDPEGGCCFDATLTKMRSLTGAEAAPFHFQIAEHPMGGLTWVVKNLKESKKEIIIALLGNGLSQKEISEILKVDKAHVSRVRKTAVKQGLLNDRGFTALGSQKYGAFDIEKYTG
jgi:putative DNA primase/helicase